MFTEQRGDAERVVLLGVLLTAGPKVSEVQQLQCQGEDAVPLEAALSKVGVDLATHVGQRLRHLQHPVELLLGAVLLPLLVVQVLATPATSVPTAWMWPFGWGLIQTFFHAGGITRSLIRVRVASSVIALPSWS